MGKPERWSERRDRKVDRALQIQTVNGAYPNSASVDSISHNCGDARASAVRIHLPRRPLGHASAPLSSSPFPATSDQPEESHHLEVLPSGSAEQHYKQQNFPAFADAASK